MDRIAFSDGHF